jgi:pimeloyl-ACP methyl ester carboxylesterase
LPGNPGLVGFYSPFLSAIRDKASSTKLAILAHAHVGHTPGIGNQDEWDAQHYGLTTQIQNAVEAFDTVKSTFGSNTKVILVGHSVGSWFALQVSHLQIKFIFL